MNSSFSLLLVASADVKMYLFPEKSIPVYLILKKVFLFSVIAFSYFTVSSQESISSQGDSYTNSIVGLDFTIGEVFTSTVEIVIR